MKFFKFNRLTMYGAAAAVGTLTVVLTFQNCSVAKFAPTPEAGTSLPSLAGSERMVTLKPEFTQTSSTNPIKVLLIVDNSNTMTASQDNLSRNMGKLLDAIKSYDANIMVVSTSQWDTIKIVLTQPIEAGFTIEQIKSNFNLTIPRFALTKSMTPDVRNARLASISSYVMALGTQGAENEAPLAILGYALDKDTKFFNKGDTALVYIITDENDADHGLRRN